VVVHHLTLTTTTTATTIDLIVGNNDRVNLDDSDWNYLCNCDGTWCCLETLTVCPSDPKLFDSALTFRLNMDSRCFNSNYQPVVERDRNSYEVGERGLSKLGFHSIDLMRDSPFQNFSELHFCG